MILINSHEVSSGNVIFISFHLNHYIESRVEETENCNSVVSICILILTEYYRLNLGLLILRFIQVLLNSYVTLDPSDHTRDCTVIFINQVVFSYIPFPPEILIS